MREPDESERLPAPEETHAPSEARADAVPEIEPIPVAPLVLREIVRAELRMVSFSGPLPPAREFGGYGDVLASAPERILAMAGREQAHQHAMQLADAEAVREDQRNERLERRIGQFLAFGIGMTALILGAFTGGWYGGITGAIGVGGLLTAFSMRRRDERSQQAAETQLAMKEVAMHHGQEPGPASPPPGSASD